MHPFFLGKSQGLSRLTLLDGSNEFLSSPWMSWLKKLFSDAFITMSHQLPYARLFLRHVAAIEQVIAISRVEYLANGRMSWLSEVFRGVLMSMSLSLWSVRYIFGVVT